MCFLHLRLAGAVLLGLLWVAAGCGAISRKTEFTVLYSNDVLGELENCGCDDGQLGGLARKAQVLFRVAGEGNACIRLDAGNLFFRKAPANDVEAREYTLKSEYILQAYNRMEYDALNIGPADLLCGLPALIHLKNKALFPFVSSNLVDAQTCAPVFEQAVLKQINGCVMGVMGLFPGKAAVPPGVQAADPLATARKMVPALRQRCDFVVVLSALGPEEDKELAQRVEGIDLIVSAQAEALSPEATVQDSTAIVQAYTRGQYCGRVDAVMSGKGLKPVMHLHNTLIPLQEDLGEDRQISALAKEYKARLIVMNKEAFFREKLRAADNSTNGAALYTGAESCRQCHEVQYENWMKTFHAMAYNTLGRDNCTYDVECLACHTTGYGEEGGYAVSQGDQSPFLNVQCESCHGPGSNHEGEKGGIIRNGGQDVCLGCHNEKNSPKFNYADYLPLVKCPGS